jgi:cellulose synthase/poly-beta-1,6-N-acetylglucosamine synthase-like glycosyltransferase
MQSQLPTISVLIVTTGNGRLSEIVEIYLRESVASEVIIVLDNPSADVKQLQAKIGNDPRLLLVRNDVHLGLTKSLNKGLAHAKGDIILRNDDDDIPDENRASKVGQFFADRPETELAFSFAIGKEDTGSKQWEIKAPLEDGLIKAKLEHYNFIVHSSLAFRKDVILAKLQGYDETFYFAQDYDLYLRAIRNGLNFSCIPEFLVTRSYHPSSITVAKRKRQILYSFASRLIHHAATEEQPTPWKTIIRYAYLLAIPNQLRALKRKFGYGR